VGGWEWVDHVGEYLRGLVTRSNVFMFLGTVLSGPLGVPACHDDG